ncbi:MAG: hypothetical protein FWH45_01275 [Methanomassiliicoccaceae archaeon]|nr:hypothetical protein [Methanomassiliicoccaceae archaeon]MCL2145799.1 hypothetical protein [Methanomassiliicoccaceae archaeon]
MSFNTNPQTAPAGKRGEDGISFAIKCLRQGRSAQAFLILSEPGAEKAPEARFALGLCHFLSGDVSAAISCFEQTLNLLKGRSAAKRNMNESSETYIRLTEEQIKEKIYLTPMDADFFDHFPEAAEQAVLLATIDAYLQKGMAEQAKRLSSGLIGPAFEEYKKKLQ